MAGTGIEGALGADGPADLAQVGLIADLAVDKSGNVYIADQYFDASNGLRAQVRRITPAGQIQTVAGCASCETTELDGALATQSEFPAIRALATDPMETFTYLTWATSCASRPMGSFTILQDLGQLRTWATEVRRLAPRSATSLG